MHGLNMSNEFCWLKDPVLVANSFDKLRNTELLCLDSRLHKNLKRMGILKVFPIQEVFIPLLLSSKKRDFLISVPTGSGKTLAYAIPIVEGLLHQRLRHLRAVVVAPTKDLVLQIYNVFRELTRKTKLVIQSSLDAENRMENSLSSDIFVTTPGKLVEQISVGDISVRYLQYLVFDEADRLLSQSYQNWVDCILDSVHQEIGLLSHRYEDKSVSRHSVTHLCKILLSATISRNPQLLNSLDLVRPCLLSTADDGKYCTPSTLDEFYIKCLNSHKPAVLAFVIQKLESQFTLIFVNSIENSNLLLKCLKFYGIKAGILSGSSRQSKKTKLIAKFNEGRLKIIICTDAASRGLDFDRIQAVINYDIPCHLNTYIHRIGRAARAGQKGQAYSIVSQTDIPSFKRMLSQKHHNLKEFQIDKPSVELLASKIKLMV